MFNRKKSRRRLLAAVSSSLLFMIAALWYGVSARAQTATIPLGSYTGSLNESPHPAPIFGAGQYQSVFQKFPFMLIASA